MIASLLLAGCGSGLVDIGGRGRLRLAGAAAMLAGVIAFLLVGLW